MTDEVDPYGREENYLRTDGRDCCHWCWLRPQAWVWGPYGTRTCTYCEELIQAGRAHDIVEEVAARITVRDGWRVIRDQEGWRRRERDKLERWVEVRTTRRPITDDEAD